MQRHQASDASFFGFFLPNKLCKNVAIIQDSVGSVIGLRSAVGRS